MSKRSDGFTLIELTLAITFFSILLMSILTLTISAGRLYIKGDTNKTINQAGRDFADTVRRDLLATGMGTITPTITIGDGASTLSSGRICLGTVTYLWNTADLLNSETPAANNAKVRMGSATGKPIKFVRIVRPLQSYCQLSGSGYPMTIPSTESATELFDGTDRDYALYAMAFTQVALSGDRGMYRVSYTLGTNEKDTTEKDASGYIRCKPNNAVLANFDYCSVNDFETLVRIGGTK